MKSLESSILFGLDMNIMLMLCLIDTKIEMFSLKNIRRANNLFNKVLRKKFIHVIVYVFVIKNNAFSDW